MSERFEIRLNDEYQKKLSDLKAEYGTTASEAIRRAIDEAHEKALVDYRLRLVAEMARMEIEDMPEPEELSRQLDEAHDPGLP